MTERRTAHLALVLLFAGAMVSANRATGEATNARTVVVERHANGTIRREASYRNGALDGRVRGWYENGAREYERYYDQGLEVGTHRGWYESGAQKFEYHYVKGVSEGEQRQWYRSGAQLTLFHHRAGHEAGQQQMWNPDGTIRSNYVVKDGRRFGLIGTMGCTGKGQPEERVM